MPAASRLSQSRAGATADGHARLQDAIYKDDYLEQPEDLKP